MRHTKLITRAHLPAYGPQHGMVLIIMLAVLVLSFATVLIGSISAAAISTERIAATATALAQAKEALIGYALKDPNRPGELPCPDFDNDGAATLPDYSGANCRTLIGHLPWKTLGLPDLRDAAGERLWYAVSNPFHAHSPDTLNSDTLGDITLVGDTNANHLIAIVFAPGASLPNQDRSAANANDYLHFLESVVTAPSAFRLAVTDDRPGGNHTYNDQLITLTHAALFPALERVIAHRVRNEIFNLAREFWRPYPFAATFTTPTSPNIFISSSAELFEGLLPVNSIWAELPVVAVSGGSATSSCTLLSGANALSNAIFRCTFSNISGLSSVNINATLTPSLALWRQYNLASSSEVRIRIKGVDCAIPDSAATTTRDCAASKVPGLNASITYTPRADGSVQVTFAGNLIPALTRIELRDVVNDPAFDWFTQNEWYKVMYYAVVPASIAAESDKHAVLVMTGAARAGQSHPSAALTDYLEGDNVTPFDGLFSNAKPSDQFNDFMIETTP